MHSLFWKIFVSILGSMALILACVVMITFHFAVDRFEEMEGVSPSTVMITAARVLETDGLETFRKWLRSNRDMPSSLELLVIDHDGNDLLGRAVPKRFQRHKIERRTSGDGEHRRGPPGPGPRIQAPNGEVYRLVLQRVQLGPFGILGIGFARWLVLSIALAVTAIVSFLLARYLSAPVRKLQGVTRELASGNLSARAGPSIGARRDEIGVLGRDFDTMAARLETLLLSQRELLRNISHELRSPLARITVALGLARRKCDAADNELNRIELETERLDALIGDVLRLASLGRGAKVLELAPTDLSALVSGVVEDANFEAGAIGKQVRREGSEPLRCLADAELVRSAIENIVRNAVRYTPEGGDVVVSADNVGDAAVIRVRDQGPGVAPEELGAIFEPFYRVAEARDRDSGGQGLGLAIAAACVKLHGGSLSARNAPGAGLEVELRLPKGDLA